MVYTISIPKGDFMVSSYLSRNSASAMLMLAVISVAIILIQTASAAEYKSGWNYKNFYVAVQGCRDSIVYQTAQDYENKGISEGQSPESLRNEVISMTPVFDHIARATCFCAINQVAKEHTIQEFLMGVDIRPELDSPFCANVTGAVMNRIQKDPSSDRLR